jgi:hypothetical protein
VVRRLGGNPFCYKPTGEEEESYWNTLDRKSSLEIASDLEFIMCFRTYSISRTYFS